MTKGRYIQSFVLQEIAATVFGDDTNNFWEANQTGDAFAMPMPHTEQWYNDANAKWVDYCVQTASTPADGDKAVYSLGIFPNFDPKYSLKRAGFLITVPPGMACRFTCPISTKTYWSCMDAFEGPGQPSIDNLTMSCVNNAK